MTQECHPTSFNDQDVLGIQVPQVPKLCVD